jgi:putative membrane protein
LRTGRLLLAAWLAVVLISAIEPRSGAVWAAETALPLFLVSWLAVTARSFPLSSSSYAGIFVFLVLHQIGAHFTYPEVPLPAWLRAIGSSVPEALGVRNHYDRLAHFAYGVLFTYPLREVAVRMVGARGFWRSAVPVSLVVTTSVLYEFIEWFFALTVGGSAGDLVLGTQGSKWDTHWDLLLATVGSLSAVVVIALAGAIAKRTAGTARTMAPTTRTTWTTRTSAESTRFKTDARGAKIAGLSNYNFTNKG